MYSKGSSPSNHRRAGMALPAVLICIAIAILLGAAMTKTIVTHYRQSIQIDHQLQSFWLAESAIQRAIHKLKLTSDYRGETWQLPADTFGASTDGGVVTIEVKPLDPAADGWNIHVESRYPEGTINQVMYERTITFKPRAVVDSPAD